ncbi:MAG: hypothetical protein KDB27_29450 [Planctomycetales bacterium]|nr:hypothetical protein [Planctomycetales bacterium]
MLETLKTLTAIPPDEATSVFALAANDILLRHSLIVSDQRYRILEIEFYFHTTLHADPFAHCHPVQATFGQWYFHRVGTGYRGGTFKGIDITFGNADAFGGILIRTLEKDAGVICGPSLCVDQLLSASGQATVEELDRAIAGRVVWDETSPLQLVRENQNSRHTVYKSSRVGLSTRHSQDDNARIYRDYAYRFLVKPRKIKKGRTELITSLAASGYSVEEIRSITGSPLRAIEKRVTEQTRARSFPNYPG